MRWNWHWHCDDDGRIRSSAGKAQRCQRWNVAKAVTSAISGSRVQRRCAVPGNEEMEWLKVQLEGDPRFSGQEQLWLSQEQ